MIVAEHLRKTFAGKSDILSALAAEAKELKLE